MRCCGWAGSSSEWTPCPPWGQEEGQDRSKNYQWKCISLQQLQEIQVPMLSRWAPSPAGSCAVQLLCLLEKVQSQSEGDTSEAEKGDQKKLGSWQHHWAVAKHSGRVQLVSVNWAGCSPLLSERLWINFPGPCNMKAILVHWSKCKDIWARCQGTLKVGEGGHYPSYLPDHTNREKSPGKECRDPDHRHRLWLSVSFPGLRKAELAEENYPKPKVLQSLFVYT